MSKKMYKYLVITLFLIGTMLLAKPSYFYLKGYAAQKLLESAWFKTKNKNQTFYPWPGAKSYPIGKISINKVDLSYIILGGDMNQALNFGIAHISDTSKPGNNGNIGLAGHRDSFFKKLEKVHEGDIIEIEYLKGAREYKVIDIQIISPNEMRWLDQTKDNCLTLITCYPFDYMGEAPMRYLIRAEEIT